MTNEVIESIYIGTSAMQVPGRVRQEIPISQLVRMRSTVRCRRVFD